MSETNSTETLTAQEIKKLVSFSDLIYHYRFKKENNKILCPFHHEKTPSFHVYEERGFCYGGCGWHGDIIQFVMDKESVYFNEALRNLSDWFKLSKQTPVKEPEKKASVQKKVRKEPVNPEIVDYYHTLLTPDKRKWLHDERFLTDQTIDYLKIGWRPDMEAYSIPFWKGIPGLSEVETMQLRYAPKEGRKSRYITLDGFWYAGLIGRYTLNPDFLVVLVGTFDAVLANQDGIPAISPNGLIAWKNRLDELKWVIGPVKELYLVPDNTTSETIESVRLANALGASIRYLPEMESGKDYSDYRKNRTAQQFIEEVLKVRKSPFIENSAHVQTVEDILDCLVEGEGDKALELLEILELSGYAGWSVCHKMMVLASEQPLGATPKQWMDMIRALEYERSYEGMGRIIAKFAEEQSLKKGNF